MRVKIDYENGRVPGPRLPGDFGVVVVHKKVVDLDCAADGAVPRNHEVTREPTVTVPHLAM